MKFSDHIIRDSFDEVYIKASEKEFELRDEYNSDLWEIEKYNIDKGKVHLYKVPVRALKIGENIYDIDGKFECYRSE